MIARVHRGSAGFGGVVDSLLAARPRPAPNPIPDEPAAPRPPAAPSHARVVWTDTRNLPTFDPRRAGRVMRATAAAAPELKRLAGVPPGGRPLLRPVYHLTLCWAVTDSPSRVEMERAADEALRALGLEERQAVLVAHKAPPPRLHIVANRVHPETGKAAGLGRDRLTLSKWAEGYERAQGAIRCAGRVKHNLQRAQGQWPPRNRAPAPWQVRQRKERAAAAKPRIGAWRSSEAREQRRLDAIEDASWSSYQAARTEALRQLQNTHDREWRRLFHRQERAREDLDRAGHSLAGRIGQWRASGRRWKDLPAAIRGKPQLLGRWQRQLAQQQTVERGLLTRDEAARARGLEQALGRTYERSTRLQMEQASTQERLRRERTRQQPEMTWGR